MTWRKYVTYKENSVNDLYCSASFNADELYTFFHEVIFNPMKEWHQAWADYLVKEQNVKRKKKVATQIWNISGIEKSVRTNSVTCKANVSMLSCFLPKTISFLEQEAFYSFSKISESKSQNL